MTTQLLIYESVVPISATRHAKHSLQVGADYGFTRNVNSLPLTAVEFLPAALEYPVVFAGDANAVMPAVILGLREKENVFLDDRGAWAARYIPAFARRYPFVFSSPDQGKTFALCVDESFPGLNTEDRGQRIFDEQGKPTQYVDGVMKFLQQYQIEFQRTQRFCNRLKELGLLAPMQAQVDLGDSGRLSLSGFMVVDRSKLKALPGETLAELMRNDSLELIYGHLHSMRHFALIRERMVGGKPEAVADTSPSPATGDASPSPAVSTAEASRKPAARTEKEPAGGKKRQT